MLQFGGWVRGVPALVPLILVALAAASSDLFDNQLGDINYCKKQCQMSIKNKSPAKVSATYQMLLQYIVTACGKKMRLIGFCVYLWFSRVAAICRCE